jgi:WD40 repeat protein
LEAIVRLYEHECGPYVAAGCESDVVFLGRLTLWDTETGKLLRQRKQPDPALDVITFSPDGVRIATGQQAQVVKIYDAATWNRTPAFANPENGPPFGVTDFDTSALTFSPDSKLVLAGSRNGLVWLLDASGKNPAQILHQAKLLDQAKPVYEAPSGKIVSVLFARDGEHAYAVESTGTVRTWKTRDWSRARDYQVQSGASSAALSPNGKALAVANADGAIRFYEAESGKLLLVLAGTEDSNSELVVAPDGRYDFGSEADFSLAHYRVAGKTVRVDQLPGNRRVRGLLKQFLQQNQSDN